MEKQVSIENYTEEKENSREWEYLLLIITACFTIIDIWFLIATSVKSIGK